MTDSTTVQADNPYVGPRPYTKDDRDRFFGRDHEANDLIPLVIAQRLVLFYAQSGAGKSSLVNARLIPGLQDRNFIVLPVGRVAGRETSKTTSSTPVSASEPNQQVDSSPVDQVLDAVADTILDEESQEPAPQPVESPQPVEVVPQARTEVQKAASGNVFVYNLLLSLEGQRGKTPEELEKMTLPEYLKKLDMTVLTVESDASRSKAKKDVLDAPVTYKGIRPMAIILDQFEEIFTTHPEAWELRSDFFQQLCSAIEADPYLWVIMVMREDYIAMLDPYAYLLPGHLRSRYYMQRMSFVAALEAVKTPAKNAGIPFQEGCAEALVDNLRQVVIEQLPGSKPVFATGQFIEPVQLQVVCYKLYEQLKSEKATNISIADLKRLAHGRDLTSFISDALGDFYDDAIIAAAKEFPNVSERTLRDFFSTRLITEARTRGLVFRGDTTTEGLPNELLGLLERKFIIRVEHRGASAWYEIVHDRFVDPILRANRSWNRLHPRPYQIEAEAWLKDNKSATKALEGPRLQEAQKELIERRSEFSKEAIDFIDYSKSLSEQNRSNRQRRLIAFFVILALVMAVLTGISIAQTITAKENARLFEIQKQTAQALGTQEAIARVAADKQRQEADVARVAADQQRQKAEVLGTQEAVQRKAADEQRQIAEEQSKLADAARADALKQLQEAEKARAQAQIASVQAVSARLASLSDYLRQDKLDLSLLLGVEAINLSDNSTTRRTLLDSIQRGVEVQVQKEGSSPTASRVFSLAFSPDGSMLAIGNDNGEVRVVFSEGRGTALTPPADFRPTSNFSINSLSFNARGNLLASASNGGVVRIWDMGTNKVEMYNPYRAESGQPIIRAVSFNPQNDLLAVATARDPVSKKGHVFLYDLAKKAPAADLDCGDNDCSALSWTTDGQKLAAGTRNGAIKIWDLAQNNRQILSLDNAHTGTVMGLEWLPGGQRFVSGALDGQIALWDITGKEVRRASILSDTPGGVPKPGELFSIRSLGVSNNGRYIVVGSNSSGRLITLWDADTLRRLNFPVLASGHTQSVEAVAFSPKGNRFATGALDSMVYFWSFNPIDSLGKQVWTAKGTSFRSLGIDASGKYLLAQLGKGSNEIKLWNQGTNESQSLKIPFTLNGLSFVPGSEQKQVAVGGLNGETGLLNITSGSLDNQSRPVPATLGGVAASPDGNTLALVDCTAAQAGRCSKLMLWDAKAAKPLEIKADLAKLKLNGINSLSFSMDGKTLGLGTTDSRIYLIGLETGEVRQISTEGLGLNSAMPISSLAISPPEVGLVAAGFPDGRIALWDQAQLGPIGQYSNRMSSDVVSMIFRQEKDRWILASASDLGDVWEWEVDPKSWIASACKLAGRGKVTVDQVASYLPANITMSNPCQISK